MGYYTNFDLQYDSAQSDPVELQRLISDIRAGKTFTDYEISLNSDEWDTMKWYGHDEDMKALSLEYPNVMFVLTGAGEESGDFWRSFYKNGVWQTVTGEVTYPDPDYSKFPIQDLTAKRQAERQARKEALLAEQARIQREIDSL